MSTVSYRPLPTKVHFTRAFRLEQEEIYRRVPCSGQEEKKRKMKEERKKKPMSNSNCAPLFPSPNRSLRPYLSNFLLPAQYRPLPKGPPIATNHSPNSKCEFFIQSSFASLSSRVRTPHCTAACLLALELPPARVWETLLRSRMGGMGADQSLAFRTPGSVCVCV